MDSSRFDSFARACDGALSRRHALAALLAGLPVAFSSSQETAGKRKHKRGNANRHKGKGKRKGNDRDPEVPDAGSGACYAGTKCQPGQGAANAGCDFSRSDLFRNLNVRGAVLSGANFSGADLSGADLRGAVLRDACLVSADLSAALLDTSTVLSGAVFCGTTMPDGSVGNSGCSRTTTCCPTSDPGGAPGSGNSCVGPWRPQTTFGGRGLGPNQIRKPFGVAVSADGQTVWGADTGNDRIAVWTTTGGNWRPQMLFGDNGSGRSDLRAPGGVAVSADAKTVWVADTDNDRIAVWALACPAS